MANSKTTLCGNCGAPIFEKECDQCLYEEQAKQHAYQHDQDEQLLSPAQDWQMQSLLAGLSMLDGRS